LFEKRNKVCEWFSKQHTIFILIKQVINMNCLKYINLYRHYGSQRLFIVSALAGLVFFMGAYGMFKLAFPDVKSSGLGPFPILVSCFFVLPIHKMFHCIPLWLAGRKARLVLKKKSLGFLPMIYCQFSKALTRNIMMVLIIFPFLAITGLSLTGAVLIPNMMPLFITFASVNVAFCSIDLLYFFFLARAPKYSFIEDSNDGLTVLIHSPSFNKINQ
jgi:hypothetical protein